MGMFNWVNVGPKPCWKCGKPVDGWQTKDSARLDMSKVEPADIRQFYASCVHCRAWNQYRVKVTNYRLELDLPAEEDQ